MHWQEILEIFPIVCDETYCIVGYVVIWLESRKKLHDGQFQTHKSAQHYIRHNWNTIHAQWAHEFENSVGLNDNVQ